jgi:hypothetical protein
VKKNAWGRGAGDEGVKEGFPFHATAETNTKGVTVVIAIEGSRELASSTVFHLTNELPGLLIGGVSQRVANT